MSNEIQKKQETLPATEADKTMALLQQAIASGTSPEALEKLVALQERILDRQASAEYAQAVSRFQALCPAIVKNHVVRNRSGQKMYKYAPLEDIIEQVRDLMAELGLSYSFDSEEKQAGIEVTCIIRHRSGHAERNKVFIPTTKGMNTNASQDAGIQLTYGKRLAFVAALGITTADEDKDGNSLKQLGSVTADQAADIRALVEQVGADQAKFLKYLNVDSFEQIAARDYDSAIAALESKRRQK